jgi:glycerate kinase
MHIITAPDSFKGSLTASEVATAMTIGIKRVFPTAKIDKIPIADGGEGTVEALITATKGKFIETIVENPLGKPVKAIWGILGDGSTAVIEMATASGLLLIAEKERNVRLASTYGTGQLIKAALDQGADRIIIGIGGSATNDGGAGMASALGVRFFDAANQLLDKGGAALAKLDHIDIQQLDSRLIHTEILIASDVNNPLCGEKGASAVYGPQKGATPAIVKELDTALAHYNEIAKRDVGIDVNILAGSGAAGGLGAGLILFTAGKMKNGIELILAALHFDNLIKDADLIITGEGHTDFQTAHGKAPVGIAQCAKKYNIPVICLSGALGNDAEEVLQQGIAAIASAVPCPMTLENCMKNAKTLLEDATERTCRLLQIGMQLNKE